MSGNETEPLRRDRPDPRLRNPNYPNSKFLNDFTLLVQLAILPPLEFHYFAPLLSDPRIAVA
jgi:hypothetical protein